MAACSLARTSEGEFIVPDSIELLRQAVILMMTRSSAWRQIDQEPRAMFRDQGEKNGSRGLILDPASTVVATCQTADAQVRGDRRVLVIPLHGQSCVLYRA